jgi:hypothetical protein
MISMVLFMVFEVQVSDSLDDEFDSAVVFVLTGDGMAFPPGFLHRFVDGIQLQELAVVGPDLLFNMAGEEVRGESKGSVLLLLNGDVIRAFELDDVFRFQSVVVKASCLSFFQDRQIQFSAGGFQGVEVFDLRFDGSEVGHGFWGLRVNCGDLR